MDLDKLYQLDLFSLSNLFSILYTIAILYTSQLVLDIFINKGKREKTASLQREQYYRRLTREALKMEAKKLEEESELIEKIDALHSDNEELKSQLDDDILDDSDWSADKSSVHSNNDDDEDPSSQDSANDDNVENVQIQKLQLEISDLQEKADQLKIIEQKIEEDAKPLVESNIINPLTQTNSQQNQDAANQTISQRIDQHAIDELRNKIKQLEMENDSLKEQVNNRDEPLVTTNLDKELLTFLENHGELTLKFLEKAYDTLIELKASHPGKEFDEYIEELRSEHLNYVKEKTELEIAKREAEIKLKLMKERYEQELCSFNDTKLELIFKNSGAKEYLDGLKEKIRCKEEIIVKLKDELETKQSELEKSKEDFQIAEKQCSVYYKALNEAIVKKEQLEAERRAVQERERRAALSQTLNMSSASSLVENSVPPPPDLDIDINALLKAANNHSSQANYNSAKIPTPPPIDSPLEELLNQSRYR